MGCEAREAEVMNYAEFQAELLKFQSVKKALDAAVETYGAEMTADILRALADYIEKPERMN